MNQLQIFNSEEFGQIRTVKIEGKPYFSASDVANALGYSNPRDAVSRHCKGVVKHDIPTSSGTQTLSFIPEGDIYRLIARSQLPSAEKFESWVFDEVIPSIRKNGGYIANQENMTPEQIVANALIVAQNIIADRDKQIAEMKPKVEFFEAVTDSKDAISMADVAKVLDFGGGRNTLFKILRQEKILQKDNRPYQEYIDRGFFRVVEQKYDKGYGETGINIKTLVFQKGVEYIRKLLMKREYKGEQR